jgi:hypothetical protein
MLYTVQADWTASQADVMQELTQLDWQYTSGFKQRAVVPTHVASSIDTTRHLKQMVSQVRDQLPQLLTYLWDNPEFGSGIWPGTGLEQLLANTSTVCELYRDDPGWRTGVHIDHRAAVATGMLFFEPADNRHKSTYFYPQQQRNWLGEQRMSSKYAHGWYAANTHHSWHTGGNMSKEYRYSLLFATFLTLPTR